MLDDIGVIVDVSDAWRLFGQLNGGAPGATSTGTDYLRVCDLAAVAGSNDAAQAAAGLRAVLAGEQDRFDMTFSCHSPTEDRWFRLSATAAPVINGSGLVVFYDPVGRAEAENLADGIGADRLLEPPDRRRATSALATQMDSAAGFEVTVLCVALDGFTTITAQYGRAVGERMLEQVASRLSRAARNGDSVHRVAVDELVVICPALSTEDAVAVAERLRDSLSAPYQHGALELHIGVAVGVSTGDPSSTVESLLEASAREQDADRPRARRHAERHRTDHHDHELRRPPMAPIPRRSAESEPEDKDELRAVRALTEAIVTHSSELVILCEADGTIAWASPAASTLFGVTPEELVGANGFSLIHIDDQQRVFGELMSIPNLGDQTTVEFRVILPDGSIRWIEESTTNLLEEPDIGAIVANLRDVTARHEAEAKATFSASLLAAVGQAVIATDLDETVLYWNDAAEVTYGWSADEALGRNVRDVIRITEDLQAAVVGEASARWKAVESWSGEIRVQSRDGTTIPILYTNSVVRDAAGIPIAKVSVSNDITERHETQMALAHQVTHDRLTDLPNRSSFDERLNRHLRPVKGTPVPVAVVALDLDRFKSINDTLGHATGDQTIQAVVTRLRSVLRPTDELFRFDGDEFILLRPGTSTDDEATALGLEAAKALSTPLSVGDHHLPLTASIGVAHSTATDTSESLLRDAGTAMSQAKADGRDRVVSFDAQGRARAGRRLTLETGLHHALERDELYLTFQPVLEIATQQTAGFEALLRWDHPDLGPVGPDEFIPIAETSGLILPIGDWVLQQSLEQLRAWTAMPEVPDDLTMAINLSARQLGQPGIADRVTRSIARSGVRPDSVHLEITESILVDHVTNAIDAIHDLRRSGARISMDDFGTGYSSLSYLNRLPIDTLKIDRSFVAGLGDGGSDTSIARAIVALADSLELDVVAEGVETEDQRAILDSLGARFGQGYLWSRPLRPDDALAWMRSQAVPALSTR